jgi:hypothetical protein
MMSNDDERFEFWFRGNGASSFALSDWFFGLPDPLSLAIMGTLACGSVIGARAVRSWTRLRASVLPDRPPQIVS